MNAKTLNPQVSSLFVSHGSPMRALGGHPTSMAWAAIGQRLPKPRAVVVASAHWTTLQPAVGAAAAPELIYDFFGFPRELYSLRYPARGEPELARRVAARLEAGGFGTVIDPARGLDHGVWVPMLHLWPDADVPVVPLTVQPRQDPRHHFELGRCLRGLADEGVLVIGSGSLTHNLHDAELGNDDTARAPAYVAGFSQWVAERLAAGDTPALCDYRQRSRDGVRAHPTDEHLLPLYIALGAAGDAPHSERLYAAITDGALAMDFYAFSPAPLAQAARARRPAGNRHTSNTNID